MQNPIQQRDYNKLIQLQLHLNSVKTNPSDFILHVYGNFSTYTEMSQLPEALIFSNLRCYGGIKISSINDNTNLSFSVIFLLNLPDEERAYFLSVLSTQQLLICPKYSSTKQDLTTCNSGIVTVNISREFLQETIFTICLDLY